MTDTSQQTPATGPLWRYVLQDYQALYHAGSAGGSAPILQHMTSVAEALTLILAERPEPAPTLEQVLPVAIHLKRALHGAEGFITSKLARSIALVAENLDWRYGYDDMPPGLEANFAFAEVVGPVGPIRHSAVKLGLVLFGPGTTYPTHSHAGITESYINISGYMSENDTGVYAPGSLIFNPPDHQHQITTAKEEPCLLSYAWTGERSALESHRAHFS